MTNPIALFLGALILGLLLLDVFLFEADNIVFLGRKFLDLVEWVAFWR